MASTDDALETYTHLALQIDPQSKQISTSSSDKALKDVVASINSLHSQLKNLETTNNVPPPPLPVNPKRSAQLQKLRETAAASARKGQFADASRVLTIAIDMAASRPGWEPIGLVREELALAYMSRSAAYVDQQMWVEGLKDAEASLECKRGPQTAPNGEKVPGNPQSFLLGGRCLSEMGKWGDAMKWYLRAIDTEGPDNRFGSELVRLYQEAKEKAETN